MLRPTVGELLLGVRSELADQVLPALPTGAAARQLKAALHVLGELARSWDGQLTALEEDNADLEVGLAALSERTGLPREPVTAGGGVFPGVHDEELRGVMTRNETLQAELEALQQRWRRDPRTDAEVDRLLLELHTRRAAQAEGRDDDG